MDRIIAIDHFSEKDAAAVTADVLNAIHYLHNIGITHRDLKVRSSPHSPFWTLYSLPGPAIDFPRASPVLRNHAYRPSH